MTRLENFSELANHPMLGQSFAKLTQLERAIAEEFILENDNLCQRDFAGAVNRMFLDRPKPARYVVIMELLSVANSKLERRGQS